MAKTIGTCQCEISRLQSDLLNGGVEMVMTIPKDYAYAARQIAQDAQGKKLSLTVSEFRKKRSLDQNAYMWVLLQRLAEALITTKDELYIEMLDRYGQFTHIIVKPEVVDRMKAEWRTLRVLGDVEVNGKQGVQLQCFFGSSTYDTQEMKVLIDGVISECHAVGISTEVSGYEQAG